MNLNVMKDHLVKSEDGKVREKTLCNAHCRAIELFEKYILRLDPFQSSRDVHEPDDSAPMSWGDPAEQWVD